MGPAGDGCSTLYFEFNISARSSAIFLLLGRKDTQDVVIDHQQHEQNNQKQTDLLGPFAKLQTDGFADEAFDQKDQNMPSVQNRDGQNIQDHQVDADDRHEVNQAQRPGLGLLAGELGDKDRPANRLRGDLPLDDFYNAHYGQLGPVPGLDDPLIKRREGIKTLNEGVPGGLDSDQPYAVFIPEDVLLNRSLRSYGYLEGFAVPFNFQ